MKKLAGVLVLLLCAAGCLKPASENEYQRTITIWEQEDATVAPFIDRLTESFRRLPGNENLIIKRVHYQVEDLRQQFQTASISGSGPDLIICPSDFGGVFSIAGFILPLNDVFDMSRYEPKGVEAVTMDGKIWGVPVSVGNHLMLMYNKKFVSHAPQNTKELFSYCDSKPAGLDYCLAFDAGEPFWLVPWLGAFGGWPIDGHKPVLNTPAMKSTLTFYMDLRKKKYMPLECDYNCMDSLFKEEKVPFIICGDWAMSVYSDKLGSNFAVGRIPMVSETGRWPSPMVSGRYFMLSSRLKGKKLALIKSFVEFYTNKENQLAQVRELKRLPGLAAASQDPAVKNNPLLMASLSQVQVGRPMPMATELRVVWDSARQYVGNILNGKMQLDDGLVRMQKDAESKAEELNR